MFKRISKRHIKFQQQWSSCQVWHFDSLLLRLNVNCIYLLLILFEGQPPNTSKKSANTCKHYVSKFHRYGVIIKPVKLPGPRRLHSAMTTEYDIPRTRTKFGDRAFSVAGPREWNALPADIRNITDLSSFKRATNTFFLYWHFRIKQFYFSRLYYVRRIWTRFMGCKMRHINGVLLTKSFTLKLKVLDIRPFGWKVVYKLIFFAVDVWEKLASPTSMHTFWHQKRLILTSNYHILLYCYTLTSIEYESRASVWNVQRNAATPIHISQWQTIICSRQVFAGM